MEEQNNQNEEEVLPKKKNWIAEIYEGAELIILVPVAVLLFFTFAFRTFVVSGDSMINTLQEGEQLIVSNTFYTPTVGDIVVLTQPSFGTDPIVKRIIATEGQRVDIDFNKGVVYIDGIAIDEPYIFEPTYLKHDMEFPITIDQDHIFVMGDNRNGSNDSRSTDIGQVDERMLMGKAYFRVSPFTYFE